MNFYWLRTSVVAFGVILFVREFAGAAKPQAVWPHLPVETAVAVRCPGGSAVADALVENTRLGAVLLSPGRRQIVADALAAEQQGEEQDNPLQVLARYGFEPDDFARLLAGEFGYALIVPRAGDESPMPVGIGWFTPGEALADRVYQALGRAIEEQSDRERPVERVDIDVAGRTVMQLSLPYAEYEYPDEFHLPDDFHELEDQERQDALQKAREEYQEAIVEVPKETACVVASTDGRIIVCHAVASLRDTPPEEQVARTAETLAQLLAAIDAGEADQGWIAEVSDEREIRGVVQGTGLGMLEAVADTQALLRMAPRGEPDDEAFQQFLRFTGLDGCGPLAVRMALDGPGVVTQAVLVTESPRQGLLRLLDQPKASPTPSPWVPSDVVTYSKISFDWGAAYNVIQTEVEKEFGDEAAPGFQMFESQAMQFTGVGPEEFLSSLGDLLHVVQFATEIHENESSDDPFSPFSQRQAFVWELRDSQPWNKLLNSIQPLVEMSGGFELTEEQGYRGYRIEQGELQMAVFLGNDHLVWTLGNGVVTPMLALLNNPPAGEDRFSESALFERAQALLEFERCHMLEISDGQRSLKTGIDLLRQLLNQFDADEASESARRWVEAAARLLPSSSEVEEMVGVGVGNWHFEQGAAKMHSVIELPQP